MVIGIATYIIILGIMLLALSPKQYDLNVGDIIEEPIKAPRDVEDKMLTEEKLEQARAKVPSVYRLDEQITDDACKDTYNMFDSIQIMRYKADQRYKAAIAQTQRQGEADTVDENSRLSNGQETQPIEEEQGTGDQIVDGQRLNWIN